MLKDRRPAVRAQLINFIISIQSLLVIRRPSLHSSAAFCDRRRPGNDINIILKVYLFKKSRKKQKSKPTHKDVLVSQKFKSHLIIMVEAVLKFEKGRQKILWKKQRGKLPLTHMWLLICPSGISIIQIELLAISGDSSKLQHFPN